MGQALRSFLSILKTLVPVCILNLSAIRLGTPFKSPWLLVKYSLMGSVVNNGGMKSIRTSTILSALTDTSRFEFRFDKRSANLYCVFFWLMVRSTKPPGLKARPSTLFNGHLIFFYFFIDLFSIEICCKSTWDFWIFDVVKRFFISGANSSSPWRVSYTFSWILTYHLMWTSAFLSISVLNWYLDFISQ